MIYYNDNDSFVCEWLRCLIRKGHLPDGPVDSRSIIEVVPSDLGPFRQCHFFAGIGGWARALELAGWPGDWEIWTASLPCQPLSVAGLRQGALDGRHLWPAFHRLVAVCRPPTIVGEQVASKDGREWFAGVRVDLEELGYACGAAVMPACAVGAPHRRERLYWCAVAYDDGERSEHGQFDERDEGQQEGGDESACGCGEEGCGVADAGGEGLSFGEAHRRGESSQTRGQSGKDVAFPDQRGFWSDAEWRIGADEKARRVKSGVRLLAHGFPNRVGALRGFGNAIVPQVAAQFVKAVLC